MFSGVPAKSRTRAVSNALTYAVRVQGLTAPSRRLNALAGIRNRKRRCMVPMTYSGDSTGALAAMFTSHPGNADNEEGISDCVNNLSELSHKIAGENSCENMQTPDKHQSSRDNGVEPSSLKLAKLLSVSARKEIANARRVLLSTANKNESTGSPEALLSGQQQEMEVPQPSKRQLRLLMINRAVPFLGFGIMDNAILILAGDAIDQYLGVILGISTLCAAAIGNIISDLCGVVLGTVIEDFSAKLGIPVPRLTHAQQQLRKVRFAGQYGNAVGLTIGCIIGMFPLLWIDSKKGEKKKHELFIDSLFRDIALEAKGLLNAEHTSLFVVNKKKGCLLGKYLHGSIQNREEYCVPFGEGISGHVAKSGQAISIEDLPNESTLDTSILLKHQPDVTSVICVPVFDVKGDVIAVLQATNKLEMDRSDNAESRSGCPNGFTSKDMLKLKSLASHVSTALQADKEDARISLQKTIQMLKHYHTN